MTTFDRLVTSLGGFLCLYFVSVFGVLQGPANEPFILSTTRNFQLVHLDQILFPLMVLGFDRDADNYPEHGFQQACCTSEARQTKVMM